MADERDSEEIRLPPSPMKIALKWVGIVAALSALVGYGIWIGTIQNSIQTLKSDVDENEKAHKANAEKIAAAETRERDRLNTLSKAMSDRFNSDKDEFWNLKMAMAAVNHRVASYHSSGGSAPRPTGSYGSFGEGGGGGIGVSKSRLLSTAAKRRAASKQADNLVEDVLEDVPEEAPPMPTF